MSKRNSIFGIVALIIIVGGIYFFTSKNKTNAPQIVDTGVLTNGSSFSGSIIDSIGFTPACSEEILPLKQIHNYEGIKKKYGLQLNANQEKYLDENKFLLVNIEETCLSKHPTYSYDDMIDYFDDIRGLWSILDRKPEDTRLVTPDIVLHAYHRYFEMTLEELEKKELSITLGEFLDALYDNLSTAIITNGGVTKERYQNLKAQIVLAKVLFENKNVEKPKNFKSPEEELDYANNDKNFDNIGRARKILNKYSSDIPANITKAIEYDLKKVYDGNERDQSKLFGQYSDELATDFTQFTPRSHYTKSSRLRAYFRTMMYLGRSSYFMKKDVGITDTVLLTKLFSVKSRNGIVPLDPWKKIMEITGFYAGKSDDITYTEWQEFMSKMSGTDSVSLIAKNIYRLRNPKILSDIVVDDNIWNKDKNDLLRDSLAFRIFGQRFTLDAWILNDLTAGQEKSNPRRPSTPSALFVSAALGDDRAKQYIPAFLQNTEGFTPDQLKDFLDLLDKKRNDISKIRFDEWFNSMGSAWLYVLGGMTHNYGAGYPQYMKSMSFLDKQIQVFLGSYAELKHDTLLYAKQSYAEMGGGGDDDRPIPPVVKGFVEPNLIFWNRFLQLIDYTQQVFVNNNIFVGHNAMSRLNEFKKICVFYRDIAKKELQGQQISDDEYEMLRTKGLSFMAQPFEWVEPDENSGKIALIADIHTDGVKNQILYEATGKPYLMLAIIGNENTPRVAASIVYNHYEFTDPLGKRLTDEDWRARVYNGNGKMPEKNFWYQSLMTK